LAGSKYTALLPVAVITLLVDGVLAVIRQPVTR
jgi:hypothetical protein